MTPFPASAIPLVLGALAGLAPAGPGSFAGQDDAPVSSEDLSAAVTGILIEEADPADATIRLRTLGTAAFAPLFEILSSGKLVVAGDSGASGPVALSDEQRSACLEAVARMSRGFLIGELERRLEEGVDLDQRRAVLFILGAAGRTDDLRLLVGAASYAQPPTSLAATIVEAFEQALTAVLAREPEGCGTFRNLFHEAHPDLAESIVRALGSTETAEAMSVLAALLGEGSQVDRMLLIYTGHVGQRLSHLADVLVQDRVRLFLESDRLDLRREAALACGRLEDFAAVPQLIELLENEDRALRANALWALRRITGHTFDHKADPWRLWLESELRWWDEEASQLLLDLGSSDLARVHHVVNELGQHRYQRHRLATELTRVRAMGDPELLRRVCHVLAALESKAAVPFLLQVLEQGGEVGREAAWESLRTVTGKDLPLDAALWAAACR